MPGLSGDIANLIVQLQLDDSRFTGRVNTARGALQRLGPGLAQTGRGVNQLGTGLARVGTVAAAAAAGGLTAVITTAASMEEAFTGVEKTADGTVAQFEELRNTLRTMSSETGTAFEELARIGEIGGALGVDITGLDEFVDVVNRLSVSTDLTADSAATAIGTLRTILHLGDEELEGFADTLVALGNAGASTEPQIVDLAARFAAAGNRAGLSADEILALSSAVTSMGVEVEAGGTALSQVFNNIAVAIGTGADEVKGFTDVLGISAAEFRRRWETDALGTFQDFLSEIGKLDPIAQAVALDMAGITGARQLNAVGLMADNYGFVGEQLEVAADAQGDLRKESDKFFGTSAAGFRRLRENVRLSAEVVGNELLPVVNELITEFIDWLRDPAIQANIKEFGKNLASGIRDFAKEVKGADFGALMDTFKGAAGIAKTAFDAFRSLPGPIQQLILAAVVANKVTGGGVSMIAQGIGNILAGTIRVAFAGALSGLGGGVGGALATALGTRGSAANPMFVWVQNPGGIGGGAPVAGGAATAAKGGFSIVKFLGFATGVGLASVLGIEVGKAVAGFLGVPTIEETAGPAVAFESAQVDRIVEAGTTTADQVRMVDDGIQQLVSQSAMYGGFGMTLTSEQLAVLVQQREALYANLSVGERIALLTGKNYTGGPEKQKVLEARLAAVDASIGSAAQADHADNAALAAQLLPDTALIAGNTAPLPQLPNIVTQAKAGIEASIGAAGRADHADAAVAAAKLDGVRSGVGGLAGLATSQIARLNSIQATSAITAAKDFSPTVNVATRVNLSNTIIANGVASVQQYTYGNALSANPLANIAI